MNAARWIGIDPGKLGGIAVLEDTGRIDLLKLQTATEADVVSFLEEAKARAGGTHAMIERVRSSPQMGVTSAFTFGCGYGTLKGILAALKIPFEEVLPRKWQSRLDCLSGGNKNVTKRRAQELFPKETWTHATADAILIAAYGRWNSLSLECRA